MSDNKRILSKRFMLLIVTFLLPLLCNYAMLAINGYKMSLNSLLLNNNDEVFWQAQTAGMVKYCMPKGFFGYNGSSAQFGTLGAWGIFPFLPYVLFARVFGWSLISRHVANIFFLGLALLMFALMTELNNVQILLLNITYILLPVTVGYSLTAMTEGERYSLAIIAVGMLVRIYKKQCSLWFKFIVVPLIIFYMVLSYEVMIICVPVYIMIVLKHKQIHIKVLLTVGLTTLVEAFARIINSVTTAEYKVNTGPVLFDEIKQKFMSGIIQGIEACIIMFYKNLARLGPRNLINISSRSHGFYSAFLAVYVLICFVLFGILIYQFIKNEYAEITVVAAWFLWGFAFLYGAVYSNDEVTLTRGLNCGLVMGLMFYIAADTKKILMAYYCMAVLLIVPSIGYIHDICEAGYEASLKIPYIEAENRELANVMKIDMENSPWKNTIAYYGNLGTEYLEIPEGFGLNYMIDNQGDSRMGWAVVRKDNSGLFEIVDEELRVNGFTKTYENNDFYIYKNEASIK